MDILLLPSFLAFTFECFHLQLSTLLDHTCVKVVKGKDHEICNQNEMFYTKNDPQYVSMKYTKNHSLTCETRKKIVLIEYFFGIFKLCP